MTFASSGPTVIPLNARAVGFAFATEFLLCEFVFLAPTEEAQLTVNSPQSPERIGLLGVFEPNLFASAASETAGHFFGAFRYFAGWFSSASPSLSTVREKNRNPLFVFFSSILTVK